MKKKILQELKSIRIPAAILFISVMFFITLVFLFFFRSIQLDPEQVRSSAPTTFLVVLAITVLFIIGYWAVRYFTVLKPLNKIDATIEKIAHGDFSQRLPEENAYGDFAALAHNVNRMTDELESSALLKTDFISNVSHELKTPLAVISNYAAFLESETVSEDDRKEYAHAISLAARRMNELITNILRLNRLENQQLSAKMEAFDLSAQLGECLLGFEDIWVEKDIEMEIDIPDGIYVESEAELLGLVWNNLLSNAFKFTEQGGKVQVSLAWEDGIAAVSVQDTGCGMDEETGRHIFDKFYQGDTSHATQGNGLGLALVKRVIDLVDGEISVMSIPGEGSTFTIRI